MQLEHDYSDPGLANVFEKANALIHLMFFSDLEAWLLDLAEKDGIKIAYGILALLYLQIDDLETAREASLIAWRYFPQTKMWGGISQGCVRMSLKELKCPLSI